MTLGERETVPLAEELQLLRLYAAIMTERFTPRVKIDWQIVDDSLQIRVPTLLLQPLLENAFKHGVERATGVTRIEIASQRTAGQLQLQPYPQGDLSWHHLWFIAYLFVYCLLLVPLFARWRKLPCTLQPGNWLYALGLVPGLNEAILKPLFPQTHNLTSDWYTFNHYSLAVRLRLPA